MKIIGVSILALALSASVADAALTKKSYPSARKAALYGAAASFSRAIQYGVGTWAVNLRLIDKTKTTQRYRATMVGVGKIQVVKRQPGGQWKADLSGVVRGDRNRASEYVEHVD
jgi:hypothetical protein